MSKYADIRVAFAKGNPVLERAILERPLTLEERLLEARTGFFAEHNAAQATGRNVPPALRADLAECLRATREAFFAESLPVDDDAPPGLVARVTRKLVRAETRLAKRQASTARAVNASIGPLQRKGARLTRDKALELERATRAAATVENRRQAVNGKRVRAFLARARSNVAWENLKKQQVFFRFTRRIRAMRPMTSRQATLAHARTFGAIVAKRQALERAAFAKRAADREDYAHAGDLRAACPVAMKVDSKAAAHNATLERLHNATVNGPVSAMPVPHVHTPGNFGLAVPAPAPVTSPWIEAARLQVAVACLATAGADSLLRRLETGKAAVKQTREERAAMQRLERLAARSSKRR